MRWLCVLVVLSACSQAVPRKPWRPPPPMAVEDVAAWFVKAALAGDENTARTLVLRSDQLAQMSKKSDAAEWDAAVDEALEDYAREGNGEDYQVRVKVIERRTLMPATDEKVLRDVDVAIVQATVNDRRGPPMLFIKTDEGWRFSPKH